MPSKDMSQLTELLVRVRSGDPQARDALFTAAYAELHRLARGERERRGSGLGHGHDLPGA